jgi:hypothetical protein
VLFNHVPRAVSMGGKPADWRLGEGEAAGCVCLNVQLAGVVSIAIACG